MLSLGHLHPKQECNAAVAQLCAINIGGLDSQHLAGSKTMVAGKGPRDAVNKCAVGPDLDRGGGVVAQIKCNGRFKRTVELAADCIGKATEYAVNGLSFQIKTDHSQVVRSVSGKRQRNRRAIAFGQRQNRQGQTKFCHCVITVRRATEEGCARVFHRKRLDQIGRMFPTGNLRSSFNSQHARHAGNLACRCGEGRADRGIAGEVGLASCQPHYAERDDRSAAHGVPFLLHRRADRRAFWPATETFFNIVTPTKDAA